MNVRATVLALCLCGSGGAALALPATAPDRARDALIVIEPRGLPELKLQTLAIPGDQDEAQALHTVVIANQRTALPRLTDTPRTARKYHKRSVAALAAFRAMEDANFANRGRILAHRMSELGRFRSPPEFHPVTSGAEFLDALIVASRDKPIKNLVVYGHAASAALFMREDIGFYADVGEVATRTDVVTGSDDDRQLLLRLMGARDLSDFERYVKEGHIRFAEDAVIVFAGCGVAGRRDAEVLGIAGRIAAMLGATVVASVGVTDQSMAHSQLGRSNEYSRGTWVKFYKSKAPERLSTKVIDVLRFLTPDAPNEPVPEPVQVESMPSERLRCADMPSGEPALCGGAAPDESSGEETPARSLAALIRTRFSAPAPRPS